MLAQELTQPIPALMALDFDLAADSVLTDWEIEVRRDTSENGHARAQSLSPEEAFNLL